MEYGTPDAIHNLQQGSFLSNMSNFWFQGHPDYDKLCMPFAHLIRQSGKRELLSPEWESTVDGQLAQLILCDQLSRNCFRGTDEAYAYDEAALQYARRLSDACIVPTDPPTIALQGDFYPPCSTFCITAMMHSEEIKDHVKAFLILEWAKAKGSEELSFWWNSQAKSLQEHNEVLKKFGRYPHRNDNKGRKSTKDEKEWLANIEDLPGWAKSQL